MTKYLFAAAAAAALAIVAQSASASEFYAFGGSFAWAGVLSTSAGDVSDNYFQGWVSDISGNVAGPLGNPNYIVGNLGGSNFRDYFVFDISGLTGPVSSASLVLEPDDISQALTYTLYDATAQIPHLFDAVSPNAGRYNALASGAVAGVYSVNGGQAEGPNLSFGLDANGLAALNAHIAHGDTQFALGGSATDNVATGAPEPAAWALMIGGFGLAGAALRRRRALSAAA